MLTALGANLGVAAAKFVAAAITGSASMLAVGVHSVADSGNQVLLLIGGRRSRQAPSEWEAPGVDRVIHLRTVHLGPDELLVAAKIAVSSHADGADIATTIDDAEARVRDALPSARIIYLEPDIYRPAAR